MRKDDRVRTRETLRHILSERQTETGKDERWERGEDQRER